METQEQKVNRLVAELDQTDPLWVFKAFLNKDSDFQKNVIMQWMRSLVINAGEV
jgi:hypothetical protein